jgi:hypothetical protein
MAGHSSRFSLEALNFCIALRLDHLTGSSETTDFARPLSRSSSSSSSWIGKLTFCRRSSTWKVAASQLGRAQHHLRVTMEEFRPVMSIHRQ